MIGTPAPTIVADSGLTAQASSWLEGVGDLFLNFGQAAIGAKYATPTAQTTQQIRDSEYDAQLATARASDQKQFAIYGGVAAAVIVAILLIKD